VAAPPDVSRPNRHARLTGSATPRRRHHKAQDAAVVPLITALVAARPTCGYRRTTAILNRQLRAANATPVNHERVYRIMQAQNPLLARPYTERPGRPHNGKIVTIRSNLRWCRDGFEFTCWNGDIVRGAFIIDGHDRGIIAWCAVANAGVSGSDVRDMMPAAVEARFGGHRAPHQVEMLSALPMIAPLVRATIDDGSPCIAEDTRVFARQPGLKPCVTPLKSPQGNGIPEAFVNPPKRDCVNITPLPDAATVPGSIAGWFEDYNENHPHPGLKMRPPREVIAAQTTIA